MRVYWTLVKRELGSHFLSWSGYIVIASVLLLLGGSFTLMIFNLSHASTDRPLTEEFYSTFLFWTIFLVAVPLIPMRSFAQEKSSGTFETLMTAPVSDLEVVLAKFSGAFIFYTLLWLPMLGCLALIRFYSHDPTILDPGTIASTFLGLLLLGGMYMAMGCFASAVTKNQIIAAVVTLALGLVLFLPSFAGGLVVDDGGWRDPVIRHLNQVAHMQDFSRGVIDSRPLVYYSSLLVLFLFLALKAVESRRWK